MSLKRQEATVDMDSMVGVPDLSKLPGFAADDVAANMGGHLSDAQTRNLRVQVRNRGVGLAALVGVAIFNWANGADFLWLAIVAVGITVAIYQFATAIADMTNPVVSAVEGDVSIEGGGERSSSLRIGGKKFSLNGKAARIFMSGGRYRIFFLVRANLLVGAEVLPGWRPTPTSTKKHFPFSMRIG